MGALRWFHNVYTFRPMVQEILNIEQLFHLKYNKIKNNKENWDAHLVLLENAQDLNFCKSCLK